MGHRDVVWDLVFITPGPMSSSASLAGGLADDAAVTMLASASADKSIKIWVLPSKSTLASDAPSSAGGVGGVESGTDAAQGASAPSQWRLEQTLVDETNRGLVASNVSHLDDVTCLAYRPRASLASSSLALLASGSDDCVVKLWALKDAPAEAMDTPALVNDAKGGWIMGCSLHGHAGRVSSVAFGTGGRLMATSDHSGNVLVWCEAATGSSWRNGIRAAGKLTGWTMQSRIRHDSAVLCMSVGERELDESVRNCLRHLESEVWDAAEARGASVLEQALAVGKVLRGKAEQAWQLHQAVKGLCKVAEKRALVGMRDATERGEVLEWVRGLGLRETQLVWEGLMERRVWSWASLIGMTQSDMDKVCAGVRGDCETIWRGIEVLKGAKESDKAMQAGYELAHALATIGDAEELRVLRPDKGLKNKKRGFIWDGFRWRDNPAQIDEWASFFGRFFSRMETRGRDAIEKIAVSSARKNALLHVTSIRASVCTSLIRSIIKYKAVDVLNRFEKTVQMAMDEEAKQLSLLASKLQKIRDKTATADLYADKVGSLFAHILAFG